MSTKKGTNKGEKLVGTTTADNIDGLLGDDILQGLGGNDTLIGGGGNDTLDGGTGADTMKGGTGNDTYLVDNVKDVVTELAGQGTDKVKSSVSFTLSANVEQLELTGTAAINATGNTLANSLKGNAKNNVLDGKTGADTMAGGAGDDVYKVDNTGDHVTEASNQGTDRVESSVNFILGANLENLTLTGTGNINGTGNTLDNTVLGNGGNNVLDGGEGADTLRGGQGNDTLVYDELDTEENGGPGVDLLRVDASGVTIDLTAPNALSTLEKVDLGTGGGNTLVVSTEGIAALTGAHLLTVDGDASDFVQGSSEWIFQGELEPGYGTYTQAGFTLKIATNVDVTGLPIKPDVAPAALPPGGSLLLDSLSGTRAIGVAARPAGYVLAGEGATVAGQFNPMLAHVTASGARDGTIGDGGENVLLQAPDAEAVNAMLFQDADGGIVMAGASGYTTGDAMLSPGAAFRLERVDANDVLDPAFGNAGVVDITAAPYGSVATSLSQQTDGSLFVAGFGREALGSVLDFRIAHLAGDGSLDTGFNGSGFVAFTVGTGDAVANAVATEADTRAVVVGYGSDANKDFAVVKVEADGTASVGFGTDGKVLLPIGAGDDIATAVAIQADGQILVAGYSDNGVDLDFSIVRINPADGTVDDTFGAILVPVGNGDDVLTSMVLQPDGKILLAGYSFNGINDDFSIVRLEADGSLDATFGDGGKQLIQVGAGDDRAYAITLQADGSILLAGSADSPQPHFAIALLNADGSPDTTFNNHDVFAILPDGTEDTPYSVHVADLLTGYFDADGDTMRIASITADHGTLSPEAGGSFTYTPDANYNGTELFTYVISDGRGGTVEGSLGINLAPVNDAPTGAVSIVGTLLDGLQVNAVDTLVDVDGIGPLAYQWERSVDGGQHWTDVLGANGPDYTLFADDIGSQLRVHVTYTDDAGTDEEVYSAISGVVNGATAGNDQLVGDDAPNFLDGQAGDDTLSGLGGADSLNGGEGNDVLTGGEGDDTFRFGAALDAATNVDVITDFQGAGAPGGDVIQLDLVIFITLDGLVDLGLAFESNMTGEASSAGTRIIYDSSQGKLYYDEDGNDTFAAPILFATLTGAPALSADDFLIA